MGGYLRVQPHRYAQDSSAFSMTSATSGACLTEKVPAPYARTRKGGGVGGTQAQAPDAAYNCLKSHAQYAGPEVA
jgi:hypothetical protein